MRVLGVRGVVFMRRVAAGKLGRWGAGVYWIAKGAVEN